MKRTYVLLAGVAAAVIAVAVVVAVFAFDGGGSDGSASIEPTPTVAPPIVDRGSPAPAPSATPPSDRDTPVSNRDTPAPPSPTRTPAPGTTRVLAPIESAEVVVLASFPPRYRLQVKAGLPSGCAKPDGSDLTRSGNDIRVAVYNTIPSTPVACIQIYGIYDLNLDLGSDFTPSQEYRIDVNGKLVTFTAQ